MSWLAEERGLSLAKKVNYFGLSKMIIIHRDLDLLEQRQILKRIHGGANRLDHLLRNIPILFLEELLQAK
ncbi:MAG: DeoR family transcriptional regulator [Desulfobulbaceae bacterium]|nr:DeoR family transcriptional regulator [Desulfobulbaceae bacterium]